MTPQPTWLSALPLWDLQQLSCAAWAALLPLLCCWLPSRWSSHRLSHSGCSQSHFQPGCRPLPCLLVQRWQAQQPLWCGRSFFRLCCWQSAPGLWAHCGCCLEQAVQKQAPVHHACVCGCHERLCASASPAVPPSCRVAHALLLCCQPAAAPLCCTAAAVPLRCWATAV